MAFDESALLRSFPEVALAFGYGSGVFSQVGGDESSSSAMVDFIFAVDDPAEWHRRNLALNRPHYSALGSAGQWRPPRGVAGALLTLSSLRRWRRSGLGPGA